MAQHITNPHHAINGNDANSLFPSGSPICQDITIHSIDHSSHVVELHATPLQSSLERNLVSLWSHMSGLSAPSSGLRPHLHPRVSLSRLIPAGLVQQLGESLGLKEGQTPTDQAEN